MPRQNLNVDAKIGGRKKCKVRKRGCSSSSSSSLVPNYGLKRALLMGKRVGSTTPVPVWKVMMSGARSAQLQNDDEAFKYVSASGGDKVKELSVSARKLAATLWEIDRLSSAKVRREERISEVDSKQRVLEQSGLGSVALALSDLFRSPVSEIMDQANPGCHRRRASAGSQKLLLADSDLGGAKSPHNCLVETQNHARSPCRHIIGAQNRLKDVYNSLVTSKELLKVMSRVCHLEQQNSTSSSLFTALKFELDRACNQVRKLIQEQRSSWSEIEILIKRFEEEKVAWKLKEQDRIRNAITAIAGEFETERKLRRQTERLNKKLGRELSETKASLLKTAKELESEKRAQMLLEQACDELARGIGEDRAEVEELKSQSTKVEKEREMLQLHDLLREERVQMKLSEAKYQFEEKNALVDELRSELESYLKSKTREEQPDGSPSYDKIRELKNYLRETLPTSYQYQDRDRKGIESVNIEDDEGEEEEEDDDSADSDLHSIELNVDDVSRSFPWNDSVKIEAKRNSADKSKGRKSISEKIKKPNISLGTKMADTIEWKFTKQENLDAFDKRGLFEFTSQPWKKDTEDEMERYNMIKDLRDHIVSSSRMGSSQDLASPSKNLEQQGVPPKDPNEVACQG